MDPLTLTAVITSISGIVIAILTHIKTSKCWGIEIDTYSPSEQHQEQHLKDGVSTPIPLGTSRGSGSQSRNIQVTDC